MLLCQGQQTADGINLPACHFVITDRASICLQVDLVKECLPPVGIDVNLHGASG